MMDSHVVSVFHTWHIKTHITVGSAVFSYNTLSIEARMNESTAYTNTNTNGRLGHTNSVNIYVLTEAYTADIWLASYRRSRMVRMMMVRVRHKANKILTGIRWMWMWIPLEHIVCVCHSMERINKIIVNTATIYWSPGTSPSFTFV